MHFRIDRYPVEPAAAAYNGLDRTKSPYLKASIERLEIIADRPLRDRESICAALREYGYVLPDVQREALIDYCR